MSKVTRLSIFLMVFISTVSPTASESAPTQTVVVGETLSSGSGYACAVTSARSVRCWGDNDYGQINVPADLGEVKQVSTSFRATCALTVTGLVRCWGGNDHGQINVPLDLGLVKQISASSYYICALSVTGSVRCWGNYEGRLMRVPSDLGLVSQINGDGYRTCASIADGSVRCWALDVGYTDVPRDPGVVTQVSVESNQACILTAPGTVRCWGNNQAGQTDVPRDLGVAAQVSTGRWHTCALKANGLVRCWGSNLYGQARVPSDLGVVTQVSSGAFHTCVLTLAGSIRCWGNISSLVGNVVFEKPTIKAIGIRDGRIEGSFTLGSSVNARFYDLGTNGTFFYQWLRNGTAISDAIQSSYVITEKDIGTELSVTSSYTDGQTVSHGSSPTKLVQTPFVSSSTPSIRGPNEIGYIIFVDVSGWESGATLSYRWYRNGQLISGATSAEYVTNLYDLDSEITVLVTGSKSNRRTVTQSSATHKISNSITKAPCLGGVENVSSWLGTDLQPKIGAPFSNMRVGMTLKAENGTWPLGTTFCTFWLSNVNKIVPNANSATYPTRLEDGGKSFHYVVVGTDKKGKSTLRFSEPVTLKPCVDSKIIASSIYAIKGVPTRLSGSAKTCNTVDKIQFREKPYGKPWGAWASYPVTETGKFSFTRTFGAVSSYEIRAKDFGDWIYSESQKVNVRIKFALPLSFSWKQTKISQGFTQGGLILIKFTGDREFSGNCAISAVTEKAFNFALTPMGKESRAAWFTVKNGSGSGKIQMYWNGQVRVSALCKDPKFQQVFDVRLPVFKANF